MVIELLRQGVGQLFLKQLQVMLQQVGFLPPENVTELGVPRLDRLLQPLQGRSLGGLSCHIV